MRFAPDNEIKSKEKMIQFLHGERVGRFATIDKNDYVFVAPMNFVYYNDVIYLHGFPKGEKYDNIAMNPKCGFEVSKELAFLPSYFFEPPTDASLTDTLYISVVVKGTAELVIDNEEKAQALNALMENSLKIQFDYEPERPVIDASTTLKFSVQDLTGNHIKEFLATVTVTDGGRIFRFNNLTVADGDFSVHYLFPDYGTFKVLARINTMNAITVGSFDVSVPPQAQPGLVNSPPTPTSGTADNTMIVLVVAAVSAGVGGSVAASLIIKRKRRKIV